ncbi:BatA domain-containing protein [Dyadobacter tibetensis]|uniref:BatA domain-containing protein n=1 Tax=Dyadobacter tibetensis TaxID=1211851 RepID=UPI00047073BB|nr:BatA domain-containing protein [Dyadobacter tibetensis]
MSFLFPSFLWGLLAVAIPIAIHLFNFRKTKRVYFSNVAFLKAVDTKTKTIRHIKHWLVLATRILCIAALVLAFAQPYLNSGENQPLTQRAVTSLYLDNSYSMQGELNTKRYLDIATGRLDDLLGQFTNARNLQLITNDFSPKEGSLSDAGQIKDRLTTMQLATTSRSFQDILNRQVNLINRHHQGKGNHLFWFSDFQKSTAGDLSELNIDSTSTLHIIPIQAPAQKNVYIDTLWLNTPFVREGQNNSLNVKIKNSGAEDVQNLVLKLTLDNTQTSTASVSIKANSSSTARFNFNVTGAGFKKGKVSFDDYPILFDNEYYFILEASPKIKILHIYDDLANHQAIRQVFSNDSLFSYQQQKSGSIDPGNIASSDLIVLNGVNQLGNGIQQEIQKRILKGSALVVIPAPTPSVTTYNQLLSPMGIGQLMVGSDSHNMVALQPADRNIPFYRDVFEASVQQDANTIMPTARPVWQWRQSGQSLLALRSGLPYLNQISSGAGLVYLLSAPLLPTHGSMAEHALFVPTFYKIAASSMKAPPLAYTFDQNPIVYPLLDKPNTEALFKLRNGKAEVIPSQRIVGNNLLLELPTSDETDILSPGYYSLEQDGKTRGWLGLNYEKSESELLYYSADTLRQIFRNHRQVKVYDDIQQASFTQAFASQQQSSDLWKYFLYAALFFLLVEIGILRFMRA